ncbi:AMP binding enzyme [Schizosaccharomyces japonicus yFS275]|uniref:AMP binding enzyme n=1 Tax=Schizosaccharomyces japonicus (strain yFS275 / FY16936) TaxID=402676 RepID=B6K2T3_SCHJY|nr:AMP binding enzyme [Schizosaccharomyces japonicus yFS275]EEB08573.1 AMP binding enzyme [Schizosaccharomyces japonicus yFS275]
MSIPEHVSEELRQKLQDLQLEFQNGLLTEKGYQKKKLALHDQWEAFEMSKRQSQVLPENSAQPLFYNAHERSSSSSSDAAMLKRASVLSTIQEPVPQLRKSTSTKRTDVANIFDESNFGSVCNAEEQLVNQQWAQYAGKQQYPLEPRDIPFPVMDPLDPKVEMKQFTNIASVLRYRGAKHGKKAAFIILDNKGKEFASSTWEKIASRAEKVAQVIRDKSGLFRSDRVALMYRDSEIIDFVVSLFGCLIAGVVAVPINRFDDYNELTFILKTTGAKRALTTDANLKAFQRDLTTKKLHWPKGVEWWKTNEFGGLHLKKNETFAPLQLPDLAYIEFSRSPIGELHGVVISHRTIMHQMLSLGAVHASAPPAETTKPTTMGYDRESVEQSDIFLTYLDLRQSVGLISGVLNSLYMGYTTVWCPQSAVFIPGLWANLATRYRCSVMLTDYAGLKTIAYNYQNDPKATLGFSKKHPVDLGALRMCMVDCLNVDCEFQEIVADRWLKPLGNQKARSTIVPLLCLPEHGGMIISMKDWIGGEEFLFPKASRMPRTHENEIAEVLLEKDPLKLNEVVIIAEDEKSRRQSKLPGTIRVGAFWYPFADATLAIVDPETQILCLPNIVGEIWVDSPSLSGGFFGLPKQTEAIFHARTYYISSDTLQPVPSNQEFLRTGLLGFIHKGKVHVLGLYEDRLQQKVEWVDDGKQDTIFFHHYTSHLVNTIMRKVSKVFDCSAFDIYINNEHLPVVLLESQVANVATDSSGSQMALDYTMLDVLTCECIEYLLEYHQVRVYCVLICAPYTLPRVTKNGRREIGNMMCRKAYERGTLPFVYVKFAVERAVYNLPVGEDAIFGIWSDFASNTRKAMLCDQELQYSGFIGKPLSYDRRTKTDISNFQSIVQLLQVRVNSTPDDIVYVPIDGKGREGKAISWRKFDVKIATVARYLTKRKFLRIGKVVLLMYTHSEDFIYAVYACFYLGLIPIPVPPLDAFRLSEDVPALLHLIKRYKVTAVLLNTDADTIVRSKNVSQHLRQSATAAHVNLPPFILTSKINKQSKSCRECGFDVPPIALNPAFPALVWAYNSPDHRITLASYNHTAILEMCQIHKETYQLNHSKPVLGHVRSMNGIGFIHTVLLGTFLGSTTYLLSPVDFATNPLLLFQTISKYKIKDTYATLQTIEHARSVSNARWPPLSELKNLMVPHSTRTNAGYLQELQTFLASHGMSPYAFSPVYSHPLNPVVSTRSYMGNAPQQLCVDLRALRHGLIQICESKNKVYSLPLLDFGMVPVSTQIAIVNPDTQELCHAGEYGEIWVRSMANALSFFESKEPTDLERFGARIKDGLLGDSTYVRTGDFGFLQITSEQMGNDGPLVDMQLLYVLGEIGETFEVNGLSHFPCDIEDTVERSHLRITPNGCAVFQSAGAVIVVVEVIGQDHLAAIVPVIVNSILNEHQIVVDVVAFTAKGSFPRSRLRGKQRGKILASWITGRLRTIQTFIIKNDDSTRASVFIEELERPVSSDYAASIHSRVSLYNKHL